ncbi:HNH endonuclease [Patescibacteria group bacterium]|nr:MAG: HNH endonuclease [Patescibacteria group bacterium]
MRKKKWTNPALIKAAKESISFRQVIEKLGLVPAGGNYDQIKRYLAELKIDISHFKGRAWSRGLRHPNRYVQSLDDVLVKGSLYQSFKLKKRLFRVGLKKVRCEECGWAKKSEDGRIPLELDHVNGDKHDNRLVNLRILCPNCHSLKPTHRGRNKRRG